jgi:hypothetical protein
VEERAVLAGERAKGGNCQVVAPDSLPATAPRRSRGNRRRKRPFVDVPDRLTARRLRTEPGRCIASGVRGGFIRLKPGIRCAGAPVPAPCS